MTIFLVEQNAHRALQLADRGYVWRTAALCWPTPAPTCWPTMRFAKPIWAVERLEPASHPTMPPPVAWRTRAWRRHAAKCLALL